MRSPLADRIRPAHLDDVVGQRHLLGKGKILRGIIDSGNIQNMIFYGPSGTGKTTVANIAAKRAGKKLYKLNATNASVSDIKSIINDLDGFDGMDGVVLYLDEIQNFNKKQQQALLEFIENGKITLIASTTENPYFYIYNAILSRATVFEFMQVEPDDVYQIVCKAAQTLRDEGINVRIEEDAARHIAACACGDVRKAINTVEIAAMGTAMSEGGEIVVNLGIAEECTSRKAMRYDRDGDSHYDILSAFQKSLRGSDPDAGIHYLARLLEGGDLQSVCRRLLVIAAEDIGLAYPQAISITKACVDSAFQLGLPEARIPLAEAVIMLATAPKSNSAIMAIDDAISDLRNGYTGDIPKHLKDAHYGGAAKMGRGLTYQYPHAFENSYVKQQYLPDEIKNKKYYNAGMNKNEQTAKAYWDDIKNKSERK